MRGEQRDLFATPPASEPEAARPVRIELRHGCWQDVLASVRECDLLLADPPYSERTHARQQYARRDKQQPAHWATSAGLGYAAMSVADVRDFVGHWAPRTRGWFCVFTDSELYPVWRDALSAAGRTVFAPLACVQSGANVRLQGDGPSSWTTWLVVARPKRLARWGTLPGAYVGSAFDMDEHTGRMARYTGVRGAKPIWLMRAIVADYSKPGDLVVDPCAGSGSTLIAARALGRSALGAELLKDHFDKAQARLRRGFTPEFTDLQDDPPRPDARGARP